MMWEITLDILLLTTEYYSPEHRQCLMLTPEIHRIQKKVTKLIIITTIIIMKVNISKFKDLKAMFKADNSHPYLHKKNRCKLNSK